MHEIAFANKQALMTTSKPTISMTEAARRLGVSTNTVSKAVRLGQLKAARIGLNKRVFADSVEALLTHNAGTSGTPLATVQAAIREHFGQSANVEQAGQVCVALGFAPTKGSVDRAVLDRLQAVAGNPLRRAQIRTLCKKGTPA